MIIIFDQQIPVIMAAFMAKMSQQRAIRLIHILPGLFAYGIVRFRQIDRDQPVIMTGNGMIAVGQIGIGIKKFKGKSAFRIFVFADDRKFQTEKRI